jgi:hypothetical protein
MTRDRATLGTLVLLAAILGVHVLAWWGRPYSFLTDIDSQHYARLASEILRGELRFAAHVFNDRFGVTAPTAAVYAVLGVSPRASTLWPLAASLLTIGLVFATTWRSFGRPAALLAALLLATNVVQIDYAAHLIPDLVLAGFMLVGVAVIHAAREAEAAGRGRPWLHGGLCALALLAGLLTKKTVIWAMPFLLGVMALDLVRRRNRRLWTAFVVCGAACLGLYFLAYALGSGDPLHPIRNVEESHNALKTSFADRSRAQVVHRLTDAPVKFFLRQAGYGHLLLLAVPALLHALRPLRVLPSALRFWAAYTAVVLFSFWFGTTSLQSYNLLPISPRFLIPLLAPLSILGGVTLAGSLPGASSEARGRAARLLAAAAFAGGALLAAWTLGGGAALVPRWVVYAAPCLALVLLASPVRDRLGLSAARVLWGALVAVLSFGVLAHHGFRSPVKPPNPLRVLEYAFVREHLAPALRPDGGLVFTDGHTAFLLPILFDRIGVRGVRAVDWSDADAVRSHAGTPALVFVHQGTLSLLEDWEAREVPRFATDPPGHWRELASEEVPPSIIESMTLPVRGQRQLLFEIADPADLLSR